MLKEKSISKRGMLSLASSDRGEGFFSFGIGKKQENPSREVISFVLGRTTKIP